METINKEEILKPIVEKLAHEGKYLSFEECQKQCPEAIDATYQAMQEYANQMVADMEKRITELKKELNDLKSKNTFYCNDELINNACEDFDTPKCTKQCNKCKSEIPNTCSHSNYRSGHSPFVACICLDCGEEI